MDINNTTEQLPFLSKQLYEAFPALMKRLPGPHNGIFSSSKCLEASIRAEIERHKLDLDPSNPRDYIDTFLIEEKVWCLQFFSKPVNMFENQKLTICLSVLPPG